MQGSPQQTAWHVVPPQPGGRVGMVQSVSVCSSSDDAVYGDWLVAEDGQIVVGVCLDMLQYFGSADSVFDDKCVQIYLLRLFLQSLGPRGALQIFDQIQDLSIAPYRALLTAAHASIIPLLFRLAAMWLIG